MNIEQNLNIEKKELFIEYTFDKIKGDLTSPIYIINNDLLIGKMVEQGYKMVLAGFITPEQIQLIKLPEVPDYDPVYWQASKQSKNNNNFEGGFFFVPILGHEQTMYYAIKKSFNELDTGSTSIDEITTSLIGQLKISQSDVKNIKKDGFGSIYIK